MGKFTFSTHNAGISMMLLAWGFALGPLAIEDGRSRGLVEVITHATTARAMTDAKARPCGWRAKCRWKVEAREEEANLICRAVSTSPHYRP